ncbi:hypothetical protein WL26_01640 [Burkholderia cepacia]|nr:hypothetical protein WL26_01640 [Burkholderia cepacia]
MAVFPWLSCECSISHAARMVGLSPEALTGRVRRFRLWLLRLDPSGEMERKVRLGWSTGR